MRKPEWFTVKDELKRVLYSTLGCGAHKKCGAEGHPGIDISVNQIANLLKQMYLPLTSDHGYFPSVNSLSLPLLDLGTG